MLRVKHVSMSLKCSPAHVFGCIVRARIVTTGALFAAYLSRVDRNEMSSIRMGEDGLSVTKIALHSVRR